MRPGCATSCSAWPRYGTDSPRAATAARARSSSATRRSIQGRSSRIAAAASRWVARHGSTTSTPRTASTVTRTRRARSDRLAPQLISSGTGDRVRSASDMPSFPDLSEPLTDGVVGVRLAAERDIPEILIAYQDDPELHLRMGTPRPPSGAELGRRAERAEADRMTGTALCLTIVEGGDDTCVGQIDAHRVDWENARAELGVWVAPRSRGRGLGRRALGLAGRWLLVAAGLERVELLTQPDNQ